MPKSFLKKIALSLLITSLIGANILMVQPNRANAVFGVGDIVYDPTNHETNLLILAAETHQSALAQADNLKNFVLDGLAYMIAKQFLRAITASVVNWINSGFKGNPSFLTDPAGFFADIGDQVTGAFIAQSGVLKNLCTPFSIDLRIALALKYSPYNQQRYACTLSTIITNTKNAVKNASINGFTAGDFKQGNWPAFISLTTEPQNNIYGAYLQAESDIAFQIGQKKLEKKDQLNQGRGFLSWQTCTDSGSEEEYLAKQDQQNAAPGSEEKYVADLAVKQHQKCTIKTPGSVIENTLTNNLGSGVRQLELADSINEIVNALVAQLVTQVLSAGLSSASQPSSGGLAAYTQQLQQEQATTQLNSIRSKLLESLNTYIARARSIKANRDAAVSVYISARTSLDTAKQCFVDKIAFYSSQTNYRANYTSLIQTAQQGVNAIDTITTTQFAPYAAGLFQKASDADSALNRLLQTQSAAQNAQTADELNKVSIAYNQILQDQINNSAATGGNTALNASSGLPSDADVQASQSDLAQVQTQADAIKASAATQLRACQILPQQ